ncbi:MAG TPA: hypothetical protein VEZ13_20200 [Brevibacillus sp.]|nr:hypothetical protein [Brevibacillus sp.]
MRIAAAVKYDIVAQFRHGFYYAYLIVSLLYAVLLMSLPDALRPTADMLVIFSDPAVLGFYFIGGLVILEKDQNTFQSLFVTPFRSYEYIVAKVISLTVLTILASLFIVLLTAPATFQPLWFVTGVVLSSVFFTLVGFWLAVRSRTVNGYLLSSPFYIIVLMLPAVEYLHIFSTPLFYLFPSKASLVLLAGAYRGLGLWECAYAVITLLLWSAIAFVMAEKSFQRYIISPRGGDRS